MPDIAELLEPLKPGSIYRSGRRLGELRYQRMRRENLDQLQVAMDERQATAGASLIREIMSTATYVAGGLFLAKHASSYFKYERIEDAKWMLFGLTAIAITALLRYITIQKDERKIVEEQQRIERLQT